MMPQDPAAAPQPPAMAETPGERKDRALALLQKNPPLPPAPSDDKWTWTAARLKAVYLDAFTDLGRAEIAELVGVTSRGFYKWTQHADYKRYLAELVFSDGLADKVARAKTRKTIADKLAEKIINRLAAGGNLNAERLPDLVRSLESLLGGLREDSADWSQKTAGAMLGHDAGPRRSGLDIVERINAIPDAAERATVKRHLLSVFREYIGADADAQAAALAPVPDVPPDSTGRPSSMPDASQVASMLDFETLAEPETTTDAPAAAHAASVLDFQEEPTAPKN